MRREPQSIVVGMATFRRPELLTSLLPRILDQIEHLRQEWDQPLQAGVVVVDNDPSGSARETVLAIGDDRIHYAIETEPGISSARNRVLREAGSADLLVLLDDDETPHEGWLLHLVTAHRAHRADAVSGPVRAVFDEPEDAWVAASGTYLEPLRTGTPTGTALRRAATNNLLLDLRTVRAMGLRFDPRFGLTGGEDSLFTGQLTAAGGRLVWCAEALVDDIVPAARNTRRFQLHRRFAQAATTVRVEKMLAEGAGARARLGARWLAIGGALVLKGAAQTLVGRLTGSLPRTASGESRVASGLGVLAGSMGLSAEPYSRTHRPRRGWQS